MVALHANDVALTAFRASGVRSSHREGDRYIGYFELYAVSHDALDRDEAVQEETRNAARSLVETVERIRRGEDLRPDKGLVPPRKK